jgi:hypothetical protein
MKIRITAIPKAQAGMELMTPQVAELESGEIYQDIEGGISKISDQAQTHEEGGVVIDDAHRILEDTSDKRKDVVSKELKLTPTEVFDIVGYKPKSSLTHSKSFEFASEQWDKKYKSLEKKVQTNLDYAVDTNSNYAKNSLDFNMEQLKALPNKEDIFDMLFNHQEEKKAQMEAMNQSKKFAVGGKNKFKEPLRWYDVAHPIENLINSDRVPVNYDSPEVTWSTQPELQSVLPQLQSATADYNTMLQKLPANAVGYANAASLYASKYNTTNQMLGQAENVNNDITNKWMQYEDQMRNAKSQTDFGARQQFEQKYLTTLEKQRQQRAISKGDLYNTLAQNRKLNREGDLVMSMFNYYDQFGDYTGNPYKFNTNSLSTSPIKTDAKGNKYYVNPETNVTTKLK